MSLSTVVTRSQLCAAATAAGAVGFLTCSPPAPAHPMLPMAPACSQWSFPGTFSLKQSNGDTVRFTTTGHDVRGWPATATGGLNGPLNGFAGGDIQGDTMRFSIDWTNDTTGDYSGRVGSEGIAHGQTQEIFHPDDSAFWDSTVPLVCRTPAAPAAGPAAPPAAPPPPAPPAAAATAARLAVNATGPTTLKTGMAETYTVTVSNPGDAGAPVELFISFTGNLRQTGQPAPWAGFDCTVNNYAGGTTSVHCATGQLQSKETATINVQGQGSATGAGQLVVNINSSDPAAQFVQKSRTLNVSIT